MTRHQNHRPFGWGRTRRFRHDHDHEHHPDHGSGCAHQGDPQPSDTGLPPARPLTMAEGGRRFRVVSIAAGHRATHRLAELGILSGVEVTVVQGQRGGPLLLAVHDTRLAIERGIAHKILVQPAPPDLPQPQPALNGKTKPHETARRRPCW
ncbi:MAG: ferrous iron transport protein A [Chloroflexaceae bacterium]|nr:ferrous iron transport protein A [Chloroflexaceae bacterium]